MSLKRQIEAAAINAYKSVGVKNVSLQQLSEISTPIKVKFFHNGIDYNAVFFESQLQEITWEIWPCEGKIKFKR